MNVPSGKLNSSTRRALLKMLASAGVLGLVERNLALAQTAPDYKALVCVFLQGGNDGENTLVRYDSAGYQTYAGVRTVASNLNIPQNALLPIQPRSSAYPLGFHPACGGLQQLFNQGQLAAVANVGILAAPSTKAGLETGGTPRPASLFSHPDQEQEVQTSDAGAGTRVGWGGRIADKLHDQNPESLFPALTSFNGLRTFTTGATSIPLSVPANPFLVLKSSTRFQFDALRDAALREVLSLPRNNVYQVVAQLLSEEGLAAASVVMPIMNNPNSMVAPFFNGLNGDVAAALGTAAKLIEARAQTRMRRQIFFINHGGYDTHNDQLIVQGRLLGQLSPAVKAFTDAMATLGLSRNVTLFTLSEMGRTFKPAANAGTDHGWGGYSFIAGGAVKGGDVYGRMPTLVLNGPDDLGKEGRWIPTTSLEQYGATLCRWFGIAEGDLPYVFPNIGAFANTNLGFMA